MKIPAGYALSKVDNLLARYQGAWARDKLKFLQEYLPPALQATRKKGGHTHFLDLFAGPGWTVSNTKGGEGHEFPGSPLIALRSFCQFAGSDHPTRFGHFHFCNLSERDDNLLRQRVSSALSEIQPPIPFDHVHLYRGDSNALVKSILNSIPTFGYVFAFLDPEGPGDLPFETIRELKRRHGSVDAYILYPSYLGIPRLLGYGFDRREPFAAMFDRFY